MNMSDLAVVEALNDVIRQAICHGGDSGGAGYVNNTGLRNSVKNLLVVLNIDKEFKISDIDSYGDYANTYDPIVSIEH